MKRALLPLLTAAALCLASPAGVAATDGPRDDASRSGAAVEADYDPAAAFVEVVQRDFDIILDYIDSDGGFSAGLRYFVFLLFGR